jgi:hypothetical protein
MSVECTHCGFNFTSGTRQACGTADPLNDPLPHISGFCVEVKA